ncbi:MAG: AMP-binding protein [Cyanobacteria bacterium P01_D01_bin.14]
MVTQPVLPVDIHGAHPLPLQLQKIVTAPPDLGQVQLGHTLPSLLDMGCDRTEPGTLNQWTPQGWQTWPLLEFRESVEALALGLADAGRRPGERAILLLDNDIGFALADVGSLLAALVTVPIDPTLSLVDIRSILKAVAPTVLFIQRQSLLEKLWPDLASLPQLKLVVLGDGKAPSLYVSNQGTCPPSEDGPGPGDSHIVTLGTLQNRGRITRTTTPTALRARLSAQDLATIVYTIDEAGQPLGARLTHENLSGNILAAFNSMPGLTHRETALSFLPLTHVFARSFLFGHLAYGHTVYFSNPKRVMKHLKTVKPSVFITVPRLLERFVEAILSSEKQLSGVAFSLFNWGWQVAQRHQLGQPLGWFDRSQLWLARQLIWHRWLDELGGRLRFVVCGGAALPAQVANLLTAMGLPVLQGYGLTETSSVLTTTKPIDDPQWNQAGSVGIPIPGVTLAVSEDGEILVNSPYVMQGYWNAPAATATAFSHDWFHTGDRGHFSADGLLVIDSCKKSLFKLSIGKYVAPLPIEAALRQSSLVQQALVVGPGQKFCGALIVPDLATLGWQQRPTEWALSHPNVLARYQILVDRVNRSLSRGSTIKAFRLVMPAPAVLSSFEQPEARAELYRALAADIRQLYQRPQPPRSARVDVPPSPNQRFRPAQVHS